MLSDEEKQKMKLPDLNKLKPIFSKYYDIEAVYLFGSIGSGKLHAESDLDLAIMPKTASLRQQKLEILKDLAEHGFCNVDLVFLDVDDIVIKYEAIYQNRLIYSVEGFERGSTYSNIIRKYLDFSPYLKVQREAYKKRLLNGPSWNHT